MMQKTQTLLRILVKRKGKAAFLDAIKRNGKLLDVGCGNNSPFRCKTQRPDIYYVGLDIDDYNQESKPRLYADSYIVTSPDNFANEIVKFEDQLDAVLSYHNIEHCNHPNDVLRAMLKSLKAGGKIYLAFPCEESVTFPKRRGTLNFYDDVTHQVVPNYENICASIKSEGLQIDFASKRYRPFVLMILGFLLEPFGAIMKRNMPAGSTWALYGFESVIWASRPVQD